MYSGNFLGQVEVDHYQTVRAMLGIHPFQFMWQLKPGETFQTTEAILVYTENGLGSFSRMSHRFIRRHVMKSHLSRNERPILINIWEAFYFSLTEEKILRIAQEARDVGIELLVVDDGWFGRRTNDARSLGDWRENRAIFPKGLAHFAEKILNQKLRFGLWIEPEMVSPDSDLYRQHPDWILRVPEYSPVLSRNQWILDLSREDVVRFLIDTIDRILTSIPISYIKWDMNRYMTDIGSFYWPASRQQ
ncbi:MAG: alpha-galactosidase, partial [Thermicanus sp.]|nr:alpha-galactosidase [Thermicanus sp.]